MTFLNCKNRCFEIEKCQDISLWWERLILVSQAFLGMEAHYETEICLKICAITKGKRR